MRLVRSASLSRWGAAATLWVVITNSPASAQNGSPGQALTERADARLRALHDEADRLVGEARTMLGRLRQLEVARQLATAELRQAEEAVAEAAAGLEGITAEIDQLQAAADDERPRLAGRLVEMYKLGRGRYLRMILSTTDVRAFGRATRMVAELAARDRARVRTYEARLVALKGMRAEAEAKRGLLEQRQADAGRARASADRAIATHLALVREIDERRDLNAQLLSELQVARQKLDATLSTVGATPMVALPIGPFRGVLPWPAAGVPQPPSATTVAAQRLGLAIVAEEGSAVQAVYDGVVAFAGSFDGLGTLVIIDHGEQTFSLYGQLAELAVGKGMRVKQAQEIGRVGTSTLAQPALYFELRVNGRPVNPRLWLEGR